MKRLLVFMSALAVVSLAFVSCKDDFNEQDFLKLQSDLRLKQDSINRARNKSLYDSTKKESVESYIAALNQAGELLSFTVLVRENNVPVADAKVDLFTGDANAVATSGRTEAATISKTTDASGNAVFDKIAYGAATLVISKNGYVSGTAVVDFGGVPTPTSVTVPVIGPTGNTVNTTVYIPPQKKFTSAILPLFNKTAGSAATIKGKVTIETDATNTVPEVPPAGTTILADFSALTNATTGSGVTVTSYVFDTGNFGTATTDANGNYSMTVPATAAAYNVTLLFPTLELTQRVAVAYVDGTAITTGPEYRNQPTSFGPLAGNYTAVPAIYGAKAVFAAPPAPGRGFSISSGTAVARSLPATTISANGLTDVSNVAFYLSARGRGFTSSPAVAITGGAGTGATATTALRGFINSANVTSGGAGYAASTNFDIQFTYTDANSNVQVLNATPITVQSTAGGVLPTGNLTLPNATGYAGNGTPYTTGQGIQGFGVRVVNFGTNTVATATTQATISYVNDNEVASVQITNGGSGFTSAPTFAFSGGGTPTANAVLSVSAFRTQWDFTLNSTNTTPYKVLPAGFVFTYAANSVDGVSVQNPAKVDRISTNLTAVSTDTDFINQVQTDGSNIIAINSLQSFRTTKFWTSAPALSIIDATVTQAVALVNVDPATGQVSGLEDPTNGTSLLDSKGAGYDSFSSFLISPSATGAPGTGAVVNLALTTTPSTKAVVWSGASTLVSGGSGYLNELNQIRVPFTSGISARTGSTAVSVQAGQTTIFNYNYGSGVHKTNIAGNFRQ